MKLSLSQGMSTLFDMALKLLLLLRQEFGAAFQEATKNVVLLMNLKQKLNLGTQKTALANFQKLHLSNRLYTDTGYLSFVDASIICESLFIDCTAELNQFGNIF